MMRKAASFRSLPGARALALAHIGAAVVLLALGGCGSTGGPTDTDGGGDSGGSASGGTDGGDDGGSGGSATGGTASGGAASGGAASGGAASGGSGSDIVNACPGVEPAGGSFPPCREQSDCNVGLCQETGPTGGVCGACFASPMECLTDPDCGDGSVCVPGPEVDCQCMGPGLVCAPACTSDSCGEGQVCAEDGHCVLASCAEDGYVCPTDAVCDPARPEYPHGCAPAYCDSSDYTCPDDMVCAPERETNVHHCAPRLCETEGYVCPASTVCDPNASAKDGHGCRILHCLEGIECAPNFDCDTYASGSGCVQRTCDTDEDCDCGACVMNRCEERLFMCVVLPS